MKKLKVIQVNIYKGQYLANLIEFLRSENPDLATLQEVTSGEVNLYRDKKVNIFNLIQKETNLKGAFVSAQKLIGSPLNKFGNAILAKWPINDPKAVFLKEYRPLTVEEFGNDKLWPDVTRILLDGEIEIDDRTIHLMSWHAAWTAPPVDSAETIRQAKIVAGYLKSQKDPFILGCDLNNIPQSKTVGIINKVAKNLMLDSGVLQTTHPKIHKIAPRGYLIDYIFVSNHFKLLNLKVPEVIVSDHLPIVANLEWEDF